MKSPFSTNPLFLIFCVPIVVDVVWTVLGQPSEYWSNRQVFNEALPIYPLLQISPFLFIGFCLVTWLPITYWATKKLKHPHSLWIALSLLIGHGYNSVSWIRTDMHQWGLVGPDQMSQALALIPVCMYILWVGYLAMLGVSRHFEIISTQKKNTIA